MTNRPNQTASYTNNWPYDPLVGNEATPSAFLWTVFSVLFMIAGIGLLGWHYAVDGYASMALALGLWWVTGPISRWWESTRAVRDYAQAIAARA